MASIDYTKEVEEALQEIKDLNPNHTPEQRRIIRALIEFFLAIFIHGDRETMRKHISPRYVQHNPNLGDGPDSPFEFAAWKRQQTKEKSGYSGPPTLRYKRFLVDGDLLTVHLHWINYPGDNGINIIDVFKWDTKEFQFVEHWDCNQEVLDEKLHKNKNGIF